MQNYQTIKLRLYRASRYDITVSPNWITRPSNKIYVYVQFSVPVTPTVELNTLAMKRGESATYTFVTDQQMRAGSHSQQSVAAKFAHKRLA